jgi:parallel beta-helix repeat protein
MWLGNTAADQREYNATVNGNHFGFNGGTALAWTGGGNFTATNNTFERVFTGIKTNAIEPGTPGTVLIERNTVENTDTGHTVQLSGGNRDHTQTMAHTHVLRNNVFRNASAPSATKLGTGIYMDDTPPDNVTIEHNLIENNWHGGVFVNSGQNVTIRNNLIRKTTGTQPYGIVLPANYPYRNITVACNTVSGHDGAGLFIGPNSAYTAPHAITDNTFANNAWGVIAQSTVNGLTSARNAYTGGGGTAQGIAPGVGTPSGCPAAGPL